ncbi:MAG TPA: hypothetical protein VFX45_10140 [Solirubrobacterales bacterium]|nr:hypothetical protein [Solirubrobacterales bacterium]
MSAMSARAALVFTLAVLAVPAPGVTQPAEAAGPPSASPLYTLPPA